MTPMHYPFDLSIPHGLAVPAISLNLATITVDPGTPTAFIPGGTCTPARGAPHRGSRHPQTRQSTDPDRLVSVADACEMLGCGRTWLTELRRSGKITAVRLGRSVRFRVGDLHAFTEARRELPRSPKPSAAT